MIGNGSFGSLRRWLIRHPNGRIFVGAVLIVAAIGVLVGGASPDRSTLAAEPGGIPTGILVASPARGNGAFRRFLRWCTRHLAASGAIAVLVALVVVAAARTSPNIHYADCAAVRAAGAAPLYEDQPGYRIGLDGDRNGIACLADTPIRSGTSTSGEVYYTSCAAVRAAGAAPLYRGRPGYRTGLDGDRNGIACQSD